MAKIEFITPKVCSACGAHNFKIHGVIYNGDLNYTKLTVKCMKCGTRAEEIETKNME